MLAAKLMSRPCECTSLSEPLLIVYVISNKISCVGPFECACQLRSEARYCCFWSEPLLPSKIFVLTGKNLLRMHSCTSLTEPLRVIFGYVQFVRACAKS